MWALCDEDSGARAILWGKGSSCLVIPVLSLSGGGLAQAVHLSSSPQESLKSRDFAVYMSDTQSTVCKSSKRVYQGDWTSSLKSSYKTTFKPFILRSKCLLNACSTSGGSLVGLSP